MGHHVGAIQEVGDASETLCFALGEQRVLTEIQTRELGVFSGIACSENLYGERLMSLGDVFQNQLIALYLETCALTIEQHT